jgi:lysophospholipase L1-like esterase
LAWLFVSAIVVAHCGSTPSAPTPEAPKISCPVDQTVQSTSGQAIAVSYTSPTVTGGAPPLTSGCFPASGTLFPVGATSLLCTATDSKQRTDSCRFTVTVTQPPPPSPRISVTRFIAFGDSITEGLFPFLITPNPPGSYPAVLQSLLRARYTAQADSIVVLDEGLGGQRAADPDEFARFRDALNKDNAGAVLLMEGANDLNNGAAAGDAAAAIPALVSGLRAMVRDARGRGLPVFVATLPPQRPGGPKAGAPGTVVPANDQIRSMVAAEGAALVDVYQAFGGVPDPWIGSDGLHPSRVGLEKIAQTFYDILRVRFEIPGT